MYKSKSVLQLTILLSGYSVRFSFTVMKQCPHIHKEKFHKMQQCIKILLFHIYLKHNMFRATDRPSSGA